MSETLKDVPEFFESELGESIVARTEALGTFRELGPPDLCHVIKSTAKAGVKELGSYHYVSGIDASSSATLAAYLNSLTYSMDDHPSWFSKSNTWRIRSGIYCCFNAFSRVDVRVEVKIPGGVESYYVDVRGERHEATPAIWQETYLSAILRAILYSDDNYYRLAGYRKVDPINSLEGEVKFLEAVEALFWKGWQLGSRPEIQTATSVHNHLSSAIMKYFGDSFRFDPAIALFEKLKAKDPEVGALLAEAYIGQHEEVKAVRSMYESLQVAPMSYPLLHVQVDFLQSKGEYDKALKLAKFAVNTTPSEFLTWAKLTEVYIEMGDYTSALLTLNSCPMFTYSERDMHRMPSPQKTHLPTKEDIIKSGIMEEDSDRQENEASDAVNPTLLRLPAPALHGTFSKAYSLLTQLVYKIGWDDLLKYRSRVFVMEEEYRMQKAKEEEERRTSGTRSRAVSEVEPTKPTTPSKTSSPNEKTVSRREAATDTSDAKDSSSADHQTKEDKDESENTTSNEQGAVEEDTAEDTVEKEAVEKDAVEEEAVEKEAAEDSVEDSVEKEAAEKDVVEKDAAESTEKTDKEEDDMVDQMEQVNLDETAPDMKASYVERPKQAAEDKESSEPISKTVTDQVVFSFGNKRLCERWLDNLFMVLYEDLHMYTFWRTEASHFRNQQTPYRKTGAEWELLGDLALRLWHENEAKEAYEQCLDHKFSAKAWMKLLEIYVKESSVEKALLAAVKLTVYHQRWYHEILYPTEIARNLNKLIRKEGLSKMQNSLTSMNLPVPVQKLMTRYFDYGELFKVEGYEF